MSPSTALCRYSDHSNGMLDHLIQNINNKRHLLLMLLK